MTINHQAITQKPQKILVIRFSSIGDIVLTTPIIRCLKNQLKCELHVLTKEQYQGIYQSNPHIDKVHSFNKKLNEVSEELKNESFDFVVDLQKNVRSSRLRRNLGKPSASFPKLNKQKWLLVNFKVDKMPDVHIVDRYFEAVQPLGVNNDGNGLDFFIPESDKLNPRTVDPILAQKYIGFVIGAKHNTKILPSEKVVSLLKKIDFPVVLLGGPEDKERGEAILLAVGKKDVVNVCGKFNLNQSASLVEQASAIITNDTGLMHIASAFQRPIISVWGNTIPQFGMYPYMPGTYDSSFISEVKNLKCRPCSKLGYKNCPKKHFKCMLDQDEQKIVGKINQFVGG